MDQGSQRHNNKAKLSHWYQFLLVHPQLATCSGSQHAQWASHGVGDQHIAIELCESQSEPNECVSGRPSARDPWSETLGFRICGVLTLATGKAGSWYTDSRSSGTSSGLPDVLVQ